MAINYALPVSGRSCRTSRQADLVAAAPVRAELPENELERKRADLCRHLLDCTGCRDSGRRRGPCSRGTELRAFVGRQVVSPVRWVGCARSLAHAGATTFAETGPGDVLTKLAKRVVPGARALAVGSPEAVQAISSPP